MSLTDPQTVTINAVTTPLPRVSVGENESRYSSADGTISMDISHQYGKRNRRMIKISTSKISPDVFDADQNRRVSASVHIVVDSEPDAYTQTELLNLWTGFITQVRASSDAMVNKVLGGES